ncbi:MAG: SDR family oxidoreductase [Planctomycetes bacterium]|nr:SDR family oxidoreductase [Planctomycetota bacterium]
MPKQPRRPSRPAARTSASKRGGRELPDESLRGLRCLVTGGGTGIGAGIARVLVARGAQVALLGRRTAPLREVAAELKAAGGTVVVATADVRDAAAVRRAVDRAAKDLGGIDALVNNAGLGGPNGCANDGPDRWDEIVRTNLDGVFFTTRAALRHVPDGGRVVNVSSVLGRFGVPGYTAYCASKHGVIGFGKALALELAPRRITVNTVCPGWTDTEMARAGMQLLADGLQVDFDAAKRAALAQVPLGRMLAPEEIGALVAWLCSPAAAGMTGQAISHCAGQVMW